MNNDADLISIVEDCWETVRNEVEGIALSTPVYPDPLWTVRDVLLHCAFWNDESTKAIDAHRQGGTYLTDTGAASFGQGLDAMNARNVATSRTVPDSEVRQRWIAAQDRFTAAIRSLDSDALAREMTCPWDERSSVATMIQNELGHERRHINDAVTAASAQEAPE